MADRESRRMVERLRRVRRVRELKCECVQSIAYRVCVHGVVQSSSQSNMLSPP